MIEIKLNDGQSGYNIIGEYIRRYWDHNTTEAVICSIGTSRDGNIYYQHNEVATPCYDDIEFLYDWWVGEKYIRLFGIKKIDAFNISGGIYED